MMKIVSWLDGWILVQFLVWSMGISLAMVNCSNKKTTKKTIRQKVKEESKGKKDKKVKLKPSDCQIFETIVAKTMDENGEEPNDDEEEQE